MNMNQLGALGKQASRILATKDNSERQRVLLSIKNQLIEDMDSILSANCDDISIATKNNMSPSMVDRLTLSEERIMDIAGSIDEVAAWKDPLGEVLEDYSGAKDIKIKKVSVPFGLIGIIFESRPNVVVDCAVLCLRSGNACILRGGKEAINTNRALVESIHKALDKENFPLESVQLVEDTSRKSATELMELTEYLDLLIPRGSKGLINSVIENAKVPVIQTGEGNCHLYIHHDADIEMARNILFNGKVSRPSVCNALENCLINSALLPQLPYLVSPLVDSHVKILADDRAYKVLKDASQSTDHGEISGIVLDRATDEDFATEFLDYIISIKTVDSLQEAIDHINGFSTGHSESIITSDIKAATKFQMEVDSACVYHNVSTRFTDGGQMGLGAEIGISTQKLHARGPMGVNQLVTHKYLISGDGQVR